MKPDRKVNVLLVDDQASNLLALESILATEHLNLVRAYSGEQALMRVLDDDYAAILMDVQMPGLDGFETAELIRQRDRSRHTPIIFLTAFQSTDEQIDRGYALGAVDFLAKPIVPAVLRAKVAVFVELYRKSEQVKEQASRLVANQRREHERALAEEKRRWEIERLREEAAREKKIAEELSRKAEELTRSIEERVRAEDQLRRRAAQQADVAALGQRALASNDLGALLEEAVAVVARNLDVPFSRVMRLEDDGRTLMLRAGVGWREGAVGSETEDAGPVSPTHSPRDVDAPHEAFVPGSPLLASHGVVGGISVDIPGRERPFGTLGAFDDEPRTFSRDDVHFLQAVANVLAAAIQRSRDEQDLTAVRDELEVQLDDMTRLHALSERLSNTLELPSVLEEVLTAVTGMQETSMGVLMLHDGERETLATAAVVGFTPAQLDEGGPAADSAGHAPESRPAGVITAIISGGVVVEGHDPDPIFAPYSSAAVRAGCQTVSSTPLLTCGGELVGVIATYFTHPHRPSARETRLVELYARQAAEFIDNARLYREIRDSDRRKGEFLAMLGHELRNPLAPILSALHLIRLPDVDRAEVEQAREVAERQVRHLARLVDDLLDISRINSGKIELRKTRVDLREAVARAVETARPNIELRRHELSVSLHEDPLPVDADVARLEQVLANLLNNASKYTEPGGKITVEARPEGGLMAARIRDTGIGIDPALLPRVFDLFTQADRSLDRSQGGLGIGLTLVRRLVELHGGTVAAYSEGEGRGSEFVVRLPPAAAHEAAVPERPPAGPRGRHVEPGPAGPRRILIVDDNADGARMLARLLKAAGHLVDVAYDGPSALEAVLALPPDVVLLDIGLPGMDGYEVARRIRQLDGGDQPLLVALTGYGQAEDRSRALDVGFDDHLIKPISPQDLAPLLGRDPANPRQRSAVP